MSNPRTTKRVTAFDAVTTPQVSANAISVADFKHIIVAYSTAASSNQVVKIQGAIGVDAPDFSSAKAVGNEWDYVESVDFQDKSSVIGDTGVTFAGADVRQFVVNVEALDWLSFEVTTGSAGALSAKVSCYTNA